MQKVKTLKSLKSICKKLKKQGKKIVFTNGCFDIIHIGHIRYLKKAKRLGDILIIGVNSDRSVRKIKGNGRPIVPQSQRAEILSNFSFVDYIVIFDEPDPINVIKVLVPHVLVKGGDWKISQVIGRKIVEKNRGKVVIIPQIKGYSTSAIIKRIKNI